MKEQLTKEKKRDRMLIRNSKDLKIFAFDIKLCATVLISSILIGLILMRIGLE